MMNRKPIECPECGRSALRKLAGRPGKVADERWICPIAILEKSIGYNGKKIHAGLVWDVFYRLRGATLSYVLRSPENKERIRKEIDAVKVAAAKLEADNKERAEKSEPLHHLVNLPDWAAARPGDVIVDRGLRTVYLVDVDGSRRRVDDPGAKMQAIDAVRKQLEFIANAPTRTPA